ncbi:fructokinase [Massilia sp. UYP11]|uniref:PfkB family carbohydrate kinase n=1 Tax=Massilia sp. UYP11 TaxID=1756385 RepID=UPI003D1F88A7
MRQDSQNVAVFGEALVDEFADGPVVGGAPFNVARHLAAFGASPQLFTRIGQDANGALVRAQFGRFGLREDGLQIDPARPTGRVVVEQHGGEHRFVILPDQAWDYIAAPALLHALGHATPALVYFGTLAQRAPASGAALAGLLEATAAPRAPRFLDVNLRADQVGDDCVLASLRQATIAKLNEEELQRVHAMLSDVPPLGEDIFGAAAAAACAGLIAAFGLRGLVVTLGERGALWFGADGTRLHAAAAPVDALCDTVGAGDAFSAVFVLGSVLEWPMQTILDRAVAFAGAICEVRGAVPSDPSFHAPWRARWFASPT